MVIIDQGKVFAKLRMGYYMALKTFKKNGLVWAYKKKHSCLQMVGLGWITC